LIRSTILHALHLLFSTNIMLWRYSFYSYFVFISLSYGWHANTLFSIADAFAFNVNFIAISPLCCFLQSAVYLFYFSHVSIIMRFLKVLVFCWSLTNYLICHEIIIFADNKDKCDWHTEHAWACKASWRKVGKFLRNSVISTSITFSILFGKVLVLILFSGFYLHQHRRYMGILLSIPKMKAIGEMWTLLVDAFISVSISISCFLNQIIFCQWLWKISALYKPWKPTLSYNFCIYSCLGLEFIFHSKK